jgi:hypothetical protein
MCLMPQAKEHITSEKSDLIWASRILRMHWFVCQLRLKISLWGSFLCSWHHSWQTQCLCSALFAHRNERSWNEILGSKLFFKGKYNIFSTLLTKFKIINNTTYFFIFWGNVWLSTFSQRNLAHSLKVRNLLFQIFSYFIIFNLRKKDYSFFTEG